MSLAQCLSSYLSLNLLIAAAFLGLIIHSYGLMRIGLRIKSKKLLDLNYLLLGLVLVFAILQPLIPSPQIFRPAAKIWSSTSMSTFASEYGVHNGEGYLGLPAGITSVSAQVFSDGWSFVLLCVLFCGIVAMAYSLLVLSRIRKNSYLIRNLGRVRIYLNDEVSVPFSFRSLRAANVVIPSSLMGRARDYRMAVAHELQHHRHGDTIWVYVVWFIKLFCFMNPFIYLWSRWISEIQEFACDETLVDQNKVDSQAYASCLVEAAETAILRKNGNVCATGLVFLVGSHILRRRIEKMFTMRKSKTESGKFVSVASGLAIISLMAATALASKDMIQDRRVTMDQAVAMAKNAQGQSDFPVVVNDLVLKELNRYIGTPEGREFMRNSLARMENYRTIVQGKINEYSNPPELMAIPIVESGYQDLPESNKMGWGAGLWMFIAPTARAFGLRVDNDVDERLDANLLTDAAMRYLRANDLRFKDWQLATLAYNIGEQATEAAIEKTGSRDAWTLIRQGYQNDKDYLPRVMAAVLIMRNPDSVK